MSKNPRQYRYCLILTTALAIVTGSKADAPIRNYPLSARPPQLLVTEEAQCKDPEGNNLIPCPHYSQFHHSEYS